MDSSNVQAESNEMPGLRIIRQFNVAPEVVFDAFTKPESMRFWWTDETTFDIDLRVGGLVELKFRHSDLSNTDDPVPEKYKHMEDGTFFTGRVTEWEPPRLLSYTWGEPTGEESLVTFKLTPKGGKVLLVLTHHRLGDNPTILISVSSGWHTHLGILSDRLEGNEPQGFWKVHNRMEKKYGKIITGS